MRIDHVGIAVESIEAALPFYKKALGLEAFHREEVASQQVRVAFLGTGGETSLELLEPLGNGGAIAKFLQSRGPGLHHVAFAVKDIKGEMGTLAKAGFPALEQEPRAGSRGHLVCFVHPKYSKGVLVELVEHGR